MVFVRLMAAALVVLPFSFSAAQNYDGLGTNPVLSPAEQQALGIARQWQETGTAPKPFRGANGELTFVYGIHQPTIVCAIFRVCVLMMQPGESVSGKQIGDSARWDITESTMGGTGADQRMTISIKPKDVGLRTSLVIATSRRIYHLELVSTQKQYMALVSFAYPDEITAKDTTTKANLTRQREENSLEIGDIANLSFAYEMKAVGKPRVRPIRVFNNGSKTIIQMPQSIQQGEAPTLVVLDEDGQKSLVNYRLQGDRYIVDAVFDRAELITGVGRRQNRIVIKRLQKSN